MMYGQLEDFLKVSSEFKLGKLLTESFHPDFKKLSGLCKNNPTKAIESIKNLDFTLFDILQSKISKVNEMKLEIQRTLDDGNKVFICGCGATGRLALVTEFLARKNDIDSVIGFMAGGDSAIVKSIESFEDHPEYGKRQFEDLRPSPDDLLICITEGGETPFVIGACEHGAKILKKAPYFLYCNPDDTLSNFSRSKSIIENSKVKKVNLTVGPQALAGSTRMQCTSIFMLALGVAIFNENIEDMKDAFLKVPWSELSKLALKESSFYEKDLYVYYKSCSDLAISIFTDTTERSPTFSLSPFENQNDEKILPSICYLYLDENENEMAWQKLLGRSPRALNWGDHFDDFAGISTLYGVDISKNILNRREEYLNVDLEESMQATFSLIDNEVNLNFENEKFCFSNSNESLFVKHLLLKLVLNNLSTVVMGRIGRFEGNIMTWVRPSNYKLIDRAIRYTQEILKRDQLYPSYEEVAQELFSIIPYNEGAIVNKLVEKFKS